MKNAPNPILEDYILTPIILSFRQHKDYLYAFIQDQIPTLARLGYKAFWIENIDPAFNMHMISKFITTINGNENGLVESDAITNQLLTYAKIYQGGVIFILNSDKIYLNALLSKITQNSAKQCQFFADMMDPEPRLDSLSPVHLLFPGPTCFNNFWEPINCFLINNQTTTSFYTDILSSFETRLKRISEEFKVVADKTGAHHGMLALNNMKPFHELGTTIEKKLAISPILQWTKDNKNKFSLPQLSLIIPNLINSKEPPISSFKKKSDYDNIQFKEKIEYWLKNASNKSNLNLNASIQRSILKLPFGEEISLEQGVVVKIEFIEINNVYDDYQLGTILLDPIEVILILHLRHKEPILCPLSLRQEVDAYTKSSHVNEIKMMRKMLEERGCIRDDSFACANHYKLFEWNSYCYTNFYNIETTNYYLSVHKFIGNYLLDKVPPSQIISLFSFGCADGKELITVKKAFQNKGITVSKLYGFDINFKNFNLHKTSKIHGIHFVQGDLSFLRHMLESTSYDGDTFKIGLFLGILVHGCMRGTYHALSVLQQARAMDTIIICGYTPVLLNKEMLKAAGYQVNAQQNALVHHHAKQNIHTSYGATELLTPENFFHLIPMNPDQRRRYLLKRSQNRSSEGYFDCLDLSLSANPYRDLGLFSVAALENLNQVDISWSYFQEEEIMPFLNKLAALNKPLEILISENQLAFILIQKMVSLYPKMTLIGRLDAELKYECPIFLPENAKSLGIYKKLPVRKL